jgi:hypothetical protein
MAVVIDELEIVPAQAPPSEPVTSTAPDLPGPSVAEQVEALLSRRAARAERLRAD